MSDASLVDQIAQASQAMAERSGIRPVERFPKAFGYPVPISHHVRYAVFQDAGQMQVGVGGIYETTGPTFRAVYRCDPHGNDYRRAQFELTRKVYLDIRAQVEAYNAVTQPIPNGPNVAVSCAEARTRVLLAMRYATYDREHQLMTDDIDAAVLRLCSL